jgi:uncharacterized protein (DUF1501 family)
MRLHADTLRSRGKSAILLWMGGGPSTIDLWDLKPGSSSGGNFKPITTKGEGEICEHLPQLAQQMEHLSIVRSMSTREADHQRGRYYMHTGFVPNPSVQHPSYGAVIAQQLAPQRPNLEIPPFVSIGGASVGPGFLGMAYAPFVVENSGRVKNLELGTERDRLDRRLQMLGLIEGNFVRQDRGRAASDHTEVLKKTRSLLTSKQLDAFKYEREPQAIRDRYGDSGFGRGCLMARRLVEVGVPFVEVDFGGWDNHSNIFDVLTGKLPVMDQAMSGLVEDLQQRGMLQDTAIIWMGEFGRTPRINGNGGRDHWASCWSAVVGGAGFQGGRVIGETNRDGTEVVSEAYNSQDLMASVCSALDIPLETVFTSRNGRPMKIANGGKIIKGLLS